MTTVQKAVEPEDRLDEMLRAARVRYVDHHPESARSFEISTEYMPGGNTRTVLFHRPFPLRIVSAEGCRITDADGYEYVNLLGEYTAGLFGHNHPEIRSAIDDALDSGVNLSGHTANEIRLAELVCARFPSIDKVRFTNSGTEANLMAIATARYVTGRKKVIVFDGGYHGGLLYFGGGGMPLNAPYEYIVGKYNDVGMANRLFDEYGEEAACVLVEPVQGSAGCIPGSPEFLQTLRSRSEKSGSVLIFDEVMTSRLSRNGAQGLLGILPDMTTLGKYIGGGMTVGAFGGADRFMEIFDPRRSDAIPHAGTFNNNALTMAAGAAALTGLLNDELLDGLNAKGEALRKILNTIARDHQVCLQFTGAGSLIGMHATRNRVDNQDDLVGSDDRIKELVFLDLIEQGYYIARRGFMALMLTVGEDEISGFIDAFRQIVEDRSQTIA